MEDIVKCLYSSNDLLPIIDTLVSNNELTNIFIEELVKTRVYVTWVLGVNIAIFSVLIVVIFAIFFSRFSK